MLDWIDFGPEFWVLTASVQTLVLMALMLLAFATLLLILAGAAGMVWKLTMAIFSKTIQAQHLDGCGLLNQRGSRMMDRIYGHLKFEDGLGNIEIVNGLRSVQGDIIVGRGTSVQVHGLLEISGEIRGDGAIEATEGIWVGRGGDERYVRK